ncbi:MAG: signal peptidase I [Defluviitaleaceae bacterium]|nr:signal peptidase I [Defluviitaleaceae bacterium]
MKQRGIGSEIFSWIKTIALAFIFAYIITQHIVVNAWVPSGSMERSIMTGDRVVAFRLSYLMSTPDRFDVVVFRFPDDPSKLFVKRVIGLPGETINIVDGRVFINNANRPLDDDPFVTYGDYESYGPFVVPEGHYFMLGDNRINSEDSRRWDTPFVERDQILGRVIFKYYRGFGFIN